MTDSIFNQQFWEEDEFWDEIASVLLEIFLQGVEGGIDALPANIQVLADFDKINYAAMDFLKRYRFSWIKDITDTTRQQTQKIFQDWMQSGAPLDALSQALESVFGSARAEMVSITEATRIFSLGNREAFESTGVVEEVRFNTSVDDLVCPLCGELDGTHLGIGDIDSYPPVHPRCRCWITPIVSTDAVSRKLDEILA